MTSVLIRRKDASMSVIEAESLLIQNGVLWLRSPLTGWTDISVSDLSWCSVSNHGRKADSR